VAANPIVLDSGALTALARKEKRLRNAIRKALNAGARFVVPTVVVAESTTGQGTHDATLIRVLTGVAIVDCDLSIARSAAALRYRVGSHAGTIDTIVVSTADHMPGAVILTGDGSDLKPLAQVRGITGVVDLRE